MGFAAPTEGVGGIPGWWQPRELQQGQLAAETMACCWQVPLTLRGGALCPLPGAGTAQQLPWCPELSCTCQVDKEGPGSQDMAWAVPGRDSPV